MLNCGVWNTVPAVGILVLGALPVLSRMRQINIVSPVQKDSDYVYTERCQQRAAQRDMQEQPDSQQGGELRLAPQALQQGCLRAGELQQFLDTGQCNFVAGAAGPYLGQSPDQRPLVC